MKKIILLILISAMMLLLSSCIETKVEKTPTNKTATVSLFISTTPPTASAIFTSPIISPSKTVAPTQTTTPQSFASRLKASSETDCMIIVAADGVRADVTMHKKINGLWQEILSTKGYIGREGVGQAAEGSPITPEGEFTLGIAFGVNANPGTKIEYLKLTQDYYWVDDPDSSYYNRLVNIKDVNKDWTSAEHLIEYPNAYAYAVAINYNTEHIPGAGSAMFLHCSIGKATSGCISIPSADMIYVIKNINSSALIIIADKEDVFSY